MAIAPELQTSEWMNTDRQITLKFLRGKVVLIEAFQMLCPGCVGHSLPQARRVHECFDPTQIAVLGLHTVFEHHAAMPPVSLKAFLHENSIAFPVGIDQAASHGPVPITMAAYKMRGTPTLIIIDKSGHIHQQIFGAISDLSLGAKLSKLCEAT